MTASTRDHVRAEAEVSPAFQRCQVVRSTQARRQNSLTEMPDALISASKRRICSGVHMRKQNCICNSAMQLHFCTMRSRTGSGRTAAHGKTGSKPTHGP